MGSATVSLAPLLGCPFGACFELAGGRLVRSAPPPPPLDTLSEDGRSNKLLIDNGEAQPLGAAQIAGLKAGGASGADVVAALCAASATFAAKTAFSQAKYAAKKARKHCGRCCAAAPSGGRVAAALFSRAPARSAFLRPDTLSLALSFSNVHAGGRVLVADASGGLLSGAAAERLGASGCVVVVCVSPAGDPTPLEALRFWNFPRGSVGGCSVFRARLSDLEDAAAAAAAAAAAPAAPPPAPAAANGCAGDATTTDGVAAADGGSSQPPLPPPGDASRPRRQHRAAAATPEQLRSWAGGGGGGGGGRFTSLLVACPSHCQAELLARLLPLLAPGAPFAVTAPCAQPLAEAGEAVLRARTAIDVELHEPWTREYQVLPGRTHPAMRMSASGGFILRGHALQCSARSDAVGGGVASGAGGGDDEADAAAAPLQRAAAEPLPARDGGGASGGGGGAKKSVAWTRKRPAPGGEPKAEEPPGHAA